MQTPEIIARKVDELPRGAMLRGFVNGGEYRISKKAGENLRVEGQCGSIIVCTDDIFASVSGGNKKIRRKTGETLKTALGAPNSEGPKEERILYLGWTKSRNNGCLAINDKVWGDNGNGASGMSGSFDTLLKINL